MKRVLTAVTAAVLLAVAVPAHADAYDCFPMCPEAPAATAPAATKLCDVPAVREAAHVNEKLRPVREIYDIATNPTGFAVKLVDEHVVHIPKWVGYAMDPKGALKAAAMNRVRDAAKKQVGLEGDCAAPEAVADAQELDFD